ncbi:MAG: DUF502 domain-containing protein [Chloroflexi bacterium]|nr:DUF502 domain-containing protein [Chloroflexota bacterium]
MADDGRESSWYSHLIAFMSARFAVGVVVLVPVAITIVILQFVFNFLDDFLGPGIESLAGRNLPGVGLLALLLLIFMVGLFAMSRFIRRASGRIERLVLKLPGVGVVYSVGKKMTGSFSGTGAGEGFGRVVMVEYPRDQVWSLGFLTGFTQLDGELHAFVYLPTAPMPNSGWIAMISALRVFDTDVSPQEAMQAVLSSGLANPDAINRSPLPEVASGS